MGSGAKRVAQDHLAESVGDEAHALADGANRIASVFHEGLIRRVNNVMNFQQDWAALVQTMQADGRTAGMVALIAVLSLAGGALALLAAREIVVRRGARFGRLIRTVFAFLLAALVILIASRVVTSDLPIRRLIILWAGAGLVGLSGRHVFISILAAGWAPKSARKRLQHFGEMISAAFIWGVCGLSTVSTLRGLGANPGLVDITSSALVSLPVLILTVFAYMYYRQPVMSAVAGPPPRTVGRLRFAIIWPVIAAFATLATFAALQISVTVQHPLPGLPLLLTLLLLLLTPHIDVTLAEWARAREQTATDRIPLASLYRTSRFAFILLALIAIGYQWAFPALAALGVHSGEAGWRSITVALVALGAAWGWNAISISFERLAQKGHDHAAHEEQPHAPRTRLETLFPLIAGTARSLIVLIASLTIMLLLGMNVWPIITGLSVFGLAISFGSQTLVRDIVSGLFFLIDDAFRMGEYIETNGAKGAVERISVRSVSLRHPRGAVATIPYGQIGKIQNFSRDWVIVKLVFRVAFDTDMEKVRKAFKQIGAELAADPEFKDDLLETFKSQGILSVEDGTLLVRGKFKSRAGKQFSIRKKVYVLVQQAFNENGIVAVPKPMIMAAATPPAAPAAPASPATPAEQQPQATAQPQAEPEYTEAPIASMPPPRTGA